MNEIIFSYTTKQAVVDGELIKIDSGILNEIGIKFPVYLTNTVYRRYVEVPANAKGLQDIDGRLFDLLYMFASAAAHSEESYIKYAFTCILQQNAVLLANENKAVYSPLHTLVILKSVITAQDIDDPSPAIFIMLPSED